MSLDVGTVTGVIRHVLERINAAAELAGVALPERQYTTTGGAVYDCAQVTVSANSITTGIAGSLDAPPPVGNCPPGWYVVLEAAIVRGAVEATQGRRGTVAPSPEAIELDTDAASADAAILTKAVEIVAGPNWDEFGQVPASIQFGELQGGLTAVVLTITVNLWNLPAEAPS